MSARRSLTVVGAGVFGVSAALELQARGFAVEVLDPGPVPHPQASSTDTSKAVRADYGRDEFYMDLALRALEGWRQWNREWGVAPFHETGILMLTRDPMQAGGFEAESLQRLRRRDIDVERMDSAGALGARFPAWSASRYADGYFNPAAGWVASAEVVRRLALQARAAGVVLRTGRRCTGLLDRGSRVTGVVLDDGTELRSDAVLVAAGAWTPFLLPHLESLLVPVGQPVVHFVPPDPSPFRGESFPVWCADIANTGWYGFPVAADGSLKIGHHGAGRRYRAGEPLTCEADAVDRCVAFARETFPALARAKVLRTRACLYCDSRDGDFLIDRDPDRPGLVVAAGGSGHGFKFAPLLGPIVADAVEGRRTAVGERFAWRGPGPRRTEHARFEG